MIRDAIINDLAIDAQKIEQTGFPLEVFPEKLQSMILGLKNSDDFLVEFLGSGMLSTASTAIGNSYQIHVKGVWCTNCSLYMIFVGRPGIGKTPPLKFLFSPLRNEDKNLLIKYKEEYRQYEQMKATKKSRENLEELIEPTLVQYVLDDFTPEAMWRTHDSNKRGIVVHVDEIMGMFNTVNRYTNSNLIEHFLSAYSGSPVKVSRLGSAIPLYVSKPCINIIGTTQTHRIYELLANGYESNGLLDRFVFVKPLKQDIAKWSIDEETDNTNESVHTEWAAIINRLLAIEMPLDAGGEPIPFTLDLSKEAKKLFYEWRNSMMDEVNAIKKDSDVDSRIMKRSLVVAKIALIMQLLRWACDESHKDFIDEKSVEAAISLSDYYEDCWVRIKSDLSIDRVGSRDERFLQMLGESFTTQDALSVGEKFKLGERAVKNILSKLVGENFIIRIKKGYYEKVKDTKSPEVSAHDAQCTNYTICTNNTPEQTEGNKMNKMHDAHSAQNSAKEGVNDD